MNPRRIPMGQAAFIAYCVAWLALFVNGTVAVVNAANGKMATLPSHWGGEAGLSMVTLWQRIGISTFNQIWLTFLGLFLWGLQAFRWKENRIIACNPVQDMDPPEVYVRPGTKCGRYYLQILVLLVALFVLLNPNYKEIDPSISFLDYIGFAFLFGAPAILSWAWCWCRRENV